MANLEQHVTVGFITGVGIYIAYRQLSNTKSDLGEAIMAGLISAAGATAPDLIEPALHPHHRGVAHSLLAGGSVGKALHFVHGGSGHFTATEQFVLSFLAVGYLSHLVLDGLTPRGLPLVC